MQKLVWDLGTMGFRHGTAVPVMELFHDGLLRVGLGLAPRTGSPVPRALPDMEYDRKSLPNR